MFRVKSSVLKRLNFAEYIGTWKEVYKEMNIRDIESIRIRYDMHQELFHALMHSEWCSVGMYNHIDST